MKQTKLLFFVFLVILVSNICVLGVPPFEDSAVKGGTLFISYPPFDYYTQGTPITLHFHVHNSTGYIMNNESTDCILHLYNQTSHIYEGPISFDDNLVDFEYSVPASVYNNVGSYAFLVYCNNSEAGFIEYKFQVTSDGSEKPSATDSTAGISIIIIILAVTIFMFFLPLIFGTLHRIPLVDFALRRACYIISLYLMSLNFGIVSTIANNASLGLTQELLMYVWLFMKAGYFAMYILIITSFFTLLKMWKEEEWNKRMGKD